MQVELSSAGSLKPDGSNPGVNEPGIEAKKASVSKPKRRIGAVLTPICWYGGKARQVKQLLPLIPPHFTYVEPFGGAASLLFRKPESPIEVYNDIDENLVNLFRVLACPEDFLLFYRIVVLLPHSRKLYYDALATLRDRSWKDNIERAVVFFICARQAFSGEVGQGWAYSVSRGTSHSPHIRARTWERALYRLPQFHARLTNVQVDCRDALQVIRTYDTRETFFYCDPPYVLSTRSGGKAYAHEMTDQQHARLVNVLLRIKGKVMLSGFESPIYKPLEAAGWLTKQYTRVRAAPNARRRGPRGTQTETLWLNYRPRDKKGRFI